MKQLDRWIIEKHERVANGVQRYTGINCFGMAHISLVCATFLAIIWFTLEERNIVAVSLCSLVILFMGSLWWKIIESTETLTGNMQFINPIRFLWEIRSLILLVSIISFLIMISGHLLIRGGFTFCYVSMMYFMACTPLPPGTSKIPKLLTSLREKAEIIFLPPPEPIPIRVWNN